MIINPTTLFLSNKHEHMHKCDNCGHIWKHDANKEMRALAEGAKDAGVIDLLKKLKWIADNEERLDYEYDRAHTCEVCERQQHDIHYPQGMDYSSTSSTRFKIGSCVVIGGSKFTIVCGRLRREQRAQTETRPSRR